MNQIINNKCPCVFLYRKPFGYKSDYVISTNYQGAFNGTITLINKGYKKIGFIGSPFDSTMNDRFEGFRSALITQGISYDKNLIKFCKYSHNKPIKELKYGEIYESTKDFIENKKVEAIFCGNDITSIGVINYLKENDLNIPQDIDIICFDDTEWLSLTYKSISAIDQDWNKIGKTVIKTLLNRIDNSNSSDYKEIKIPTKLIKR